jgi:hypothetical protein
MPTNEAAPVGIAGVEPGPTVSEPAESVRVPLQAQSAAPPISSGMRRVTLTIPIGVYGFIAHPPI